MPERGVPGRRGVRRWSGIAAVGALALGFVAVAGRVGSGEAAAAPGAATPRVGLAPCASDAAAIVSRTRHAIARFADPRVAIQDGYLAWGHDFPGMGEHWINPRLAGRNEFDPGSPPILLYARASGRPVLVGAAFLAMTSDGLPPPGPAFLAHAWHEHSGSLREELFAGDHARPGGSDGNQVVVLHVWTLATDPGQAFDVQNWALPFVREGLRPDPEDVELARAVSLVAAPSYYVETLRYGGVPDHDAVALERRVHVAAQAVRGHLVAGSRVLRASRAASVRSEWRELLRDVRERWPAAGPGIDRMLGVPRVHLACDAPHGG